MERSELAKLIDHTLLRTDATPDDITALAAEARELGVCSICVSPNMLPISAELEDVLVATVCGFPSGKHTADMKAAEAAEAVSNGADEVDMVIDIGLLKAGRSDRVCEEIGAVRRAIPDAVLKVIIESAALSEDEIVAACEAAVRARADFVKTSTGFHPAGGARISDVALMRRTVGSALGVKASGGIRDWDTAVAMVEAGASRLGLSASRAILDGGSTQDIY